MKLFIGGFAAAVLTVALHAQTPAVSTGGVLNGASFIKGQAVAPGSLVSIFGSELAGGLTANDTVPLSTSLSNVSVTFNNIPAGLYFVSPGQVNAQIPWDVLPADAASGAVNVVVTRNGVQSSSQLVNIISVSPGIFYLPDAGGWAIAINSDGSLAAPVNAIPNVATHPVKSGEGLAILATGLGAVDSPLANGANSIDKLRNTIAKPVVLVGGQPTAAAFSGLSPQFPGVNQINVIVPGGVTSGTVPLQLQVNDFTSTADVKIAVQ